MRAKQRSRIRRPFYHNLAILTKCFKLYHAIVKRRFTTRTGGLLVHLIRIRPICIREQKVVSHELKISKPFVCPLRLSTAHSWPNLVILNCIATNGSSQNRPSGSTTCGSSILAVNNLVPVVIWLYLSGSIMSAQV